MFRAVWADQDVYLLTRRKMGSREETTAAEYISVFRQRSKHAYLVASLDKG